MNRWERPHGIDGTMILSGIFAALSLAGIVAATYWLLPASGDWTTRRLIGMAGVYLFLGAWLVISWRDTRAGVFMNDSGVLVRGIRRRRFLPWNEVAGFESRPAEVLGRVTVREAIWVVARNGEAVETLVQKDAGYKRGHAKNKGRILDAAEYDEALRTLWRRLQEETAGDPEPR